jgi:hypothetical protein
MAFGELANAALLSSVPTRTVQLGMVVTGVAVIVWIWNKRDWIYCNSLIGCSWDPKVIKVKDLLPLAEHLLQYVSCYFIKRLDILEVYRESI